MWERLIRNDPNNIRLYFGDDKRLFVLADSLGYIANESDLKLNSKLRSNNLIINKAIINNPNLVKYIIGYKSSLIDMAIDNGYIPEYNDLVNNRYLGCSDKFIKYLIDNGSYDAIKYYHNINISLIDYSLQQGYKPTINDAINNSYLSYSKELIDELCKSNKDAICLYNGEDISYVDNYIKNNNYKVNTKYLKYGRTICRSDYIFNTLIQKNPKSILYYEGKTPEIFKMALDKGYVPKEEDLSSNIRYSDDIMKILIDKNVSIVSKYSGNNPDIYEYAFSKGMTKEEFIDAIGHPTDKKLVDYLLQYLYENDKELLKNYEDIIHYASTSTVRMVFDVFIPSESCIDRIVHDIRLVKSIPGVLKYYNGDNQFLYLTGVEFGYIPSEEQMDKLENPAKNVIVEKVIDRMPEYIKYYDGHESNIYIKALKKGCFPKDSVFKDINISSNTALMLFFIKADPSYKLYYTGRDHITIQSLCFDYVPSKNEVLGDSFLNSKLSNDEIMGFLVDKNIELFDLYTGNNIVLYKKMYEKGFHKLYPDSLNSKIINMINNKDLNKIEEYRYDSNFGRIMSIAISLGYEPVLKDINYYSSKYINDDLFKKIIDGCEVKELSELYKEVDGNKSRLILDKLGIDDVKYNNLFFNYSHDISKLICNFNNYFSFLDKSNISEDKFIQYGFISSNDWFSNMLDINNNDKMDSFIRVKDYFYENYYFKNKRKTNQLEVEAFINILSNYDKYPQICEYLVDNKIDFTKEVIEKLDFLFSINTKFDVNSIDDLNNIEKKFIESYKEKINNIRDNDILSLKNTICELLFNKDKEAVRRLLSIYGNTEEMRKLLFLNRDNSSMDGIIREMIIYTSMMEGVLNSNNYDYLLDMANRIIDNYDLTSKCIKIFSKYEDKVRYLYAKDISTNLTKIDDYDGLLDEKLTKELGVPVVDFTDKKYRLLVHVKSTKENIDDLVNGISSKNNNFISFSAISDRNNVDYGVNSGFDVILGYDELPIESFICSSIANMGSNGYIKKGSAEVEDITRTQRGFIETSESKDGRNSEILCYREGLKPKYVVIPEGVSIRKEVLEFAKKNNLMVAKVQQKFKSIETPIEIDDRKKTSSNYNVDELRRLRDFIIGNKNEKRRIAIFSDSHGLFEPTLAILEDARKKGIKEIYSLGDNIGTGPNPSEVMDLLSEYNVKSLRGNHESYSAFGIEQLFPHLRRTNSVSEARRNSEWTKSKLSMKQLEMIKRLPKKKIIELGGEKILLTHYINDYNTEEKMDIPDDVSLVLQGHKHFKDKDGKVITIRGAGVGFDKDDKNYASYVILTEKDGGGFDIEEKLVPYDKDDIKFDVLESDMDRTDKKKINEWVGVHK